MSMETITFQEELKKIDSAHEALRQSVTKLRDFILSNDFLITFITFEKLLGDFQDKLITLVEAVQQPSQNIQGPSEIQGASGEGDEMIPEEPEKRSLTLGKGVIVAAAIVGSAVLALQGLIQPVHFVGIVAGSVVLTFLDQISSIVVQMLHREEAKAEAPSMALEDWINESLSKIRSLYTSARFLAKVQNQTKETLPEQLGTDEALYDRRQYLAETLPSEFLSRIERIMVAVDKNSWSRKTTIINAICMAKQATMVQKATPYG